jgi:hypothetical protein
VWRAHQRHRLRTLAAQGSVTLATPDVAETQQRSAAEVGNQEADRPRREAIGESGANDLGRRDRRCRIDGDEQIA